MAAILTFLASGLGYAASLHRFFELTSHFPVQYLAVSIICAVVLTLFRDWRWVVACSVCAGLNAASVLPGYLAPEKTTTHAKSERAKIRVLLSNVFTANPQSERLIELVRSEAPDVVVLEEVDDRWTNELAVLNPLLPYSKIVSRPDNFGIGIWSRFPLLETTVIETGEYDVPSISARIDLSGHRVTILATHPVPPLSAVGFNDRNAQLSALAALVQRSSGPIILLGDLNVTMWSPYYEKLIRESGLRDARKGFGVLATWPTNVPMMMIPLDHCLISPSIEVRAIKTGRPIGSDHLPIIVDLGIGALP